MSKRIRFEKRIGEKHNRLTIISVDGFTEGKPRYRIGTVRCECNTEFPVRLSDVVSGNTTSCGCARRKHPNKAIMRMYSSYSSNAKARGYTFNLNHEEFLSLVESSCHYCGIEPSNLLTYKGESHLTNGIDRVDNDLGYDAGNSVPCCSICNQAKHTLSYDDFISWIGRLVECHKQRGNDFIKE